jgi:hypothetical protein
MNWQPYALIGLSLLALVVFYAGAYALCINEGYHNILAYQYGDVPTYCRQVTLFPFSLLF